MGNADSIGLEGAFGSSPGDSLPAAGADGVCPHLNRAVSILLIDKTIPSRDMINKAQCICYYCNPLSRNVFIRGGRRDILANNSVKIALNFNVKGDAQTSQTIITTYRRLFYGADATTLSRCLATRRFFPRGTRFVKDGDGGLIEETVDQHAREPYDRLNFTTGLLEKFNPNQVFMTPEPDLAFQYGDHEDGHRVCLQVLFDQNYTFCRGQCTLLPGSEGIIRRGSLNKDVREAENAAQKFRDRTSFIATPDSETDYYLNSESLFDQQALCPNFYIFAIYFRFASTPNS